MPWVHVAPGSVCALRECSSNFTSALAPCVADWRDSAFGISVYTIAAPSPGNAEFADYYNALFTDQSGHSTAFRFLTAWTWYPMPGQVSIPSRHIIRRSCPALPTSPDSLAAPNQPWRGNMFSLGRLLWAAPSNYPAPSSRFWCVPRSPGAQCLRECGIFVGNRATICLHHLSGVVTNAFDGSSSRHLEAGGCGVGDVGAPCIKSTGPHCWTASSINCKYWHHPLLVVAPDPEARG